MIITINDIIKGLLDVKMVRSKADDVIKEYKGHRYNMRVTDIP